MSKGLFQRAGETVWPFNDHAAVEALAARLGAGKSVVS
jgi:hypothetical protein